MIKISQLTKNIYRPKDISQFLGVTTRTLQNWDKNDKIHFQRDTVSNRRFMLKDDVIKLLNDNGLLFDDISNKKRDVIYARVSSYDEKLDGDLDRQIKFIMDTNGDLQNLLVLSEIGSNLDDKRKKFQQLLKMVINDEVNRVFVIYKDILTHFGFNYLETIFNLKGVEIVIAKE